MFDLNEVRTHDLQIMTNTFHVSDTFALTTEPSGTILPFMCADA